MVGINIQIIIGIVIAVVGLIFTKFAKPLSAMPIFRHRKGIKWAHYVSAQEFWGKERGIKIVFYALGILPLIVGIVILLLGLLGINLIN